MPDPEIELLNDLARRHPHDLTRVLRAGHLVSKEYANDPKTVVSCSSGGTLSQSALGVVNMLRSARGVKRIAMITEDDGSGVRFEEEPMRARVNNEEMLTKYTAEGTCGCRPTLYRNSVHLACAGRPNALQRLHAGERS